VIPPTIPEEVSQQVTVPPEEPRSEVEDESS